MPQPKKLTDAQLKQLYFGIARHYEALRRDTPGMTMDVIYNELYNGVYHSINGNSSTLHDLDPEEKLKAYTILNTFFSACPQFHAAPQQQRNFFNYGAPPTVIITHYSAPHYCANNDFLFTWVLLNSFNRPYYSHGRHAGIGTHHHHHHHHHSGHQSNGNADSAKAMAILLLVAVAALALVLTLAALAYLLMEALNSGERFFYNEGWLQAGVSLLGAAAGGAAIATIATLFLAGPLAGLALTAGIANPVGVVILGIVCLSIIGAAAGCAITNQIQNYILKKQHCDAIDPEDPKRFALTDVEINDLESKNIDPIKVKCAIVALRAQMGKSVPSFLYRHDDTEMRKSLALIRQLRRGEGCSRVQVGDMVFDCRKDTLATPELQSSQSTTGINI